MEKWLEFYRNCNSSKTDTNLGKKSSKEPVLEGPLWVRVTVLKESQSAQIGRDAHQKGKETEEIQKKFRGWIKGATLDRLS